MIGTTAQDARMASLGRLIDDAGLFPPARKPLDRALADHARVRTGEAAFMLGRFVCPVSRLEELADEDVPDIAAVVDAADGDWATRVTAGLQAVAMAPNTSRVTAVEIALPAGAGSSEVELLRAEVLRQGLRELLIVAEVRGTDRAAIRRALAAIAASHGDARFAAKYRCGGLAAGDVPSDATLACFIATAVQLGLPFKLTAGLHHPFRTMDPSLGVLQHGFVNALAATALPPENAVAVLRERDASAFALDARGLRWRTFQIDAEGLARARESFTAVGSCGFDDAVADLRAEGIFPFPRQ